ncbi:MAG TPA: DUF1003 domain-containing protein [Caulobacteraceae bacterium]|nr:DUF1003 domain-containing protein [Caulobacteraceae bacterium]
MTPQPPPAPDSNAQGAIFPPHIEETIDAIAKLHADHERQATAMERLVERLTNLFAQPWFVAVLTLIVGAWMAGNGLWFGLGHTVLDPPPFYWMQGALALAAVYMTSLVLTTQRRASRLAIQRERLTLELAILAEQKNAKIIQLLEELRRDHPQIPDRSDPIAEQMSTPADPGAVLEAIKETHETLMAEDAAMPATESDSPGV